MFIAKYIFLFPALVGAMIVNGFCPSRVMFSPSLSVKRDVAGTHFMSHIECNIKKESKGAKKLLKVIRNTRRKFPKSTMQVASSGEAMATQPFPEKKIHKIGRHIIDMDEIGKWRMAAATFITAIVAFAPKIDLVLIKFWSWLQNDTTALLPRLFRHDHWEWSVAVWAFFFWIHGFWLIDRSIAKADVKGVVHPWKKYRLQDQHEAEKFRRKHHRMMQAGVNIEEKSPTQQSKWHLGFWTFELPLYCLPLYIWDVLKPRRAAKIVKWGAPTAFRVCKDVTSSLLLYDFGFFVCHFLMHKIPFLYKYVHAKHHINKEVRASDIVRLSLIEEVVDVVISILALNYLRAHPFSRTIYNIIITFLLVELHCGYAFPWTPQFVVPFGLATGSKGHHYHHRYGKHYYQKFFCHVDRLFGFVQKNEGSLKASCIL